MPKLYVILRGEFAVYYDPNDQLVHALAPKVRDHMYLAGPWETLRDRSYPDVPQGSVLTLHGAQNTGIIKPTDRPNHMLNVGAKRDTPKLIPWMEVKLPLPVEIHKGLMEDTATVTIEVTKGGQKFPVSFIPPLPALVLILEYDWDGETTPFLENQVKFKWGASTRRTNTAIHLVASGFWDEGASHVNDAFRSAALLLGVDAEIDWNPACLKKEQRSPIPTCSFLLEDEVNAPWKMLGVPGALPSFEAFATKESRDSAVVKAIEDFLQAQLDDGKGSGNCGPVGECGGECG